MKGILFNKEQEIKPQAKIKDFLNKFFCGDVLDVVSKIPDNTIHMVITSPPYNVGINYDNHDDTLNYKDYLDWQSEVWRKIYEKLVKGGRVALNIAPTSIKDFKPVHHDLSVRLRKIGYIMRTEIIWYKQNMTAKRTAWGSWKSPSNPHIIPSWEYVMVFCKESWNLVGDKDKIDITRDEFIKFSDGFWEIAPESKDVGHPVPFPEELIYRLVKFYTYRGNIVLDPFGGSGTVAIVAYRTNRNFIYIDISEKYCKIAQERLEAERQVLPLWHS